MKHVCRSGKAWRTQSPALIAWDYGSSLCLLNIDTVRPAHKSGPVVSLLRLVDLYHCETRANSSLLACESGLRKGSVVVRRWHHARS